ncbi:alkane 1-monooxygenase [Immundisolibacter sp.]|uniref:alkane 1-monooxygenase n=1 Tax=Immundisolibacter sp. TaxID=1934948 RepID=UPI003F85F149
MDAVMSGEKPRLSPLTKVGALPVSAVALLPFVGYWLGGGAWHWLTIVLIFVIGPVLDRLVGEDNLNVPPQLEARYEKSLYYRLTLWLYLPVQIALVLFSYHLITNTDMALYAQIGLALSMAVGVGFGATLAHELCHHPSRLDRFIGVQVFSLCGMANFLVYHNYGHHNLVATPEDPGSARYGESFWRFMPRNIGRKLVLSWQIEAKRLKTLGKSWLSPYNLMIWLTLNELAWVVGLTWYFGPLALVLFALQYAAPRLLLSVGDYLEHYGLSRRKLSGGEYEPPRAIHSWDDSYMLSNFLFTAVDRHADHHENSGRPFQILRVRHEAPRLPYGYLTMIFAAFVPPVWRRLVHPVLEAFYDKGEVVPHALPGVLPERFVAAAHIR